MAKVLKWLGNFKIHFRIESYQFKSDKDTVLFGTFFRYFHQLFSLLSEKRFLQKAEFYLFLQLMHDTLGVDKKVLWFLPIRSRSVVNTFLDGLDRASCDCMPVRKG